MFHIYPICLSSYQAVNGTDLSIPSRFPIYRTIKMKKTVLSHIFRSEKGQAVVETALILPVILLLLGAVLDFGWIFANIYRTEYAAGVGARYAAVYAADMPLPELKEAVKDRVLENVWSGDEGTSTSVWMLYDTVTVRVESRVRTLTFVANTLFGDYYTAACSATAAF